MESRLLHWVEEHKNHLIIALVAGVACLGMLAGATAWWKARENKAQEALYNAQEKKEELEKLIGDFPKSHASLLALITLAQNSLDEKNFDGCISQYEKLYDKAGRETFFRVFALHGIAGCSKAKGDFKKAADYYERAAKEPGHVSPVVSRFEAAHTLQLANDPQAQARYQELLQEKDLSPELKDKIEEALLWFRLQKKS